MRTPGDVLVIGAGPAGQAVAASLVKARIGMDLVDRHGAPGGAYARMYSPLTLSSPARYLGLPGFPLRCRTPYLTAGEYAAYLAACSRRAGLVIERQRVIHLERAGTDYAVTLESEPRPRRYRFVVIATGMCDNPVIPEGIDVTDPRSAATPIVMHSREWRGIPEGGAGRVLIVGRGMRAVELAEECAAAGARVVMSTRQGRVRAFRRRVLGFDLRHVTFSLLRRAPRFLPGRRCVTGWRFPAIDSGFGRLLARGKIATRGPLAGLRDGVATFADGSPPWSPDLVVLATGYRFEMSFLAHDIPRAKSGYPLLRCGESPGLPDLFFLGMPCAFGADSHFLHGMGRDARTVVATVARRLGAGGRIRPVYSRCLSRHVIGDQAAHAENFPALVPRLD